MDDLPLSMRRPGKIRQSTGSLSTFRKVDRHCLHFWRNSQPTHVNEFVIQFKILTPAAAEHFQEALKPPVFSTTNCINRNRTDFATKQSKSRQKQHTTKGRYYRPPCVHVNPFSTSNKWQLAGEKFQISAHLLLWRNFSRCGGISDFSRTEAMTILSR